MDAASFIADAIVIDSTCPWRRTGSIIKLYQKGGVTALAPTVAGSSARRRRWAISALAVLHRERQGSAPRQARRRCPRGEEIGPARDHLPLPGHRADRGRSRPPSIPTRRSASASSSSPYKREEPCRRRAARSATEPVSASRAEAVERMNRARSSSTARTRLPHDARRDPPRRRRRSSSRTPTPMPCIPRRATFRRPGEASRGPAASSGIVVSRPSLGLRRPCP